ncbi:MAG: CusA/CzcA family heavy metal efflux RND transporter [Myxococcaceae bacterium]|nr:CusA/CzcA family heavy metal efflux RND transporter [Myxococcaceae bacterium]MCI0669968.1 CusA/CzcA family heavy metal efflux RND transporter [Myxococcaceae bacterium]
MFERLVEWCARRRGLMVALALVLAASGVLALKASPLDAIPDLTDTQVIVFTEWMGRSPQLVEDQVTYPLVTSFVSAPRVRTVRGFSMFGMSFVYVIFEDGTDEYWARSRVLEYLAKTTGQLPQGVTPTLGPDATASGWVFMYTLEDRTGRHDLQELRAFQDFNLRYALAQVEGVAEVASVGGYKKQYQVVVDPVRLAAFGVSLPEVSQAVQRSNRDVGGRVVEWGGREYVFRGLGYVTQKEDLEDVVVKVSPDGTPVRIRELGRVEEGADIRRGLLEWNGEGETVGGIVVMRTGQNALEVIDAVKAKLEEVKPSLPEGVEVKVGYDRSELIREAVGTLREALTEEMVVVLLFIALFLMHARSALVAIVTLPLAILTSFIATWFTGVTLNIMSLGGIIIAIGDMVDATVVMVENAHRKLEQEGGTRPPEAIIIDAAKELARPIFGSLLIIAVSFLPVFALQAQEGRLFHPLAYTKTFAMTAAAVLSVTVGPALMVLFIRGRIRPEQANPINRAAIAGYRPVLSFALRHRGPVLGAALLLVAATAWPFLRLGSEFMPPLDEGSLLFMPVTLPNVSIEEAKHLLQVQDRILKSFPEVETVLGKAGRAETPTDPAPLNMFETVIVLEPRSQWREGMTRAKLEAELTRALELPGLQSALTMPIKARVDMLTTGIRTPVGVKIFGDDLARNEEVGREIEARLRQVPGTRSVFADRETLGAYIDFIPDRKALARYGLTVMDVMEQVETAIGGQVIDQTVEGRQRFSINVRYPRELRSDREALGRVLVPLGRGGMGRVEQGGMGQGGVGQSGMAAGGGAQQGAPVAEVPLAQLGRLEVRSGPPMVKDEDASLVSYVYVDTSDPDLGGYVERAKAAVADLKLPAGYRLQWTGQYEFLERIRERMALLIPLTLLLVAGLLYFQFGRLSLVLLVMLSVPFAMVGSLWLLYLLGYNTSVAVWVGMIALIGIAAETASVMLIYLEEAYQRWRKEGRLKTPADLVPCALEGAVLRVRPLLMTVGMNLVGLMPVMLARGAGADVMRRIASPMMGGLLTLTLLTLVIIPTAYVSLRAWGMRRRRRELTAIPGGARRRRADGGAPWERRPATAQEECAPGWPPPSRASSTWMSGPARCAPAALLRVSAAGVTGSSRTPPGASRCQWSSTRTGTSESSARSTATRSWRRVRVTSSHLPRYWTRKESRRSRSGMSGERVTPSSVSSTPA